jgi:NAD(P)-dependent dehydrogenase (short-subunit alcohol dehydrogenase family)
MEAVRNVFDLSGRVAIVTGGAGFLGQRHAEAIAAFGGIPVLLDVPSRSSACATGHRACGWHWRPGNLWGRDK